MKKIILGMIVLLILSIGVVSASSYEHKIIIKIEDENGDYINLDTLRYTFIVGESRLSGGERGKGRYGGYGLGDVIDADYNGNTINFYTNDASDIHIILYDDQKEFAYHYVNTLKKEMYIEQKNYNHTIKLGDLIPISFTARVDNDMLEAYRLCLMKTNLPGRKNTDDTRYAWIEINNQTSKKVYLSSGEYSPIVVSSDGQVRTIFDGTPFSTSDEVVSISVDSDDLETSNVSIPNGYDDYTYVGIQGDTRANEYLKYWDDITNRDMVFRIEEGLFKSYNNLYLSDTAFSIYDKCLEFKSFGSINLSEFYFYSKLMTSMRSNDEIYLDTELKDLNGHTMTPIGTEYQNDVIMDLYDDEMTLVGTQIFSSYWDFYDLNLDKNKRYTAKVYSEKDSHVVTTSNFDVIYQSGVPTFTFKYKEYIDKTILHPLEMKVYNGNYVIEFLVTNESSKTRTYKVYNSGQSDELLESFEVKANETLERSVALTAEEMGDSLNNKILLKADGELYNSLELSATFASDVEGHWADQVINKLLIQSKIFNKETDKYYPNDYITRAEFSAFLALALELELAENQKTFDDVALDHNLYNFINRASSNGLISGYPNGEFRPNNSIKRQDLAIIIKKGLLLKGMIIPEVSNQLAFIDGSDVDEYALGSVEFCVEKKILSGKPGNLFDPQASLTRAEAAIVIDKVLNLFK